MSCRINYLVQTSQAFPKHATFETEPMLFNLVIEQIKSVKLTTHAQQSIYQLQSESDEFNELQIKIRDKLTQLQNNRLSNDEATESENEKIESSMIRSTSTNSVVNLNVQNQQKEVKKSKLKTSHVRVKSQPETVNNMSFTDFVPLKKINKGGYGTVVLAKHKQLQKPLAIKIIKKEDMIRKNAINRIKIEAQIYKIMELNQHKSRINVKFSDFVVRFYGCFRTPSHMFLVLDFCEQGDLNNLLNESGSFGEQWGGWLIAEIAIGLSILHGCGIVYNDLKPENILMSNDGHIKFTDFGISQLAVKQKIGLRREQSKINLGSKNYSLSKIDEQPSFEETTRQEQSSPKVNSLIMEDMVVHGTSQPPNLNSIPASQSSISNKQSSFSFDESDKKVLGTPYYIAPELLKGEAPTPKSDFWALGVCLYEFLFGFKPFLDPSGDPSPDKIFEKILNEQVQFPDDQPISPEAQDLIMKLLEKDPTKRLCQLKQIEKHPFFKDIPIANLFCETPPVVPNKKVIDETPMFKTEDWVKEILQEQEQEEKSELTQLVMTNSLINKNEELLKDFSFTNKQLIMEEATHQKGENTNSYDGLDDIE